MSMIASAAAVSKARFTKRQNSVILGKKKVDPEKITSDGCKTCTENGCGGIKTDHSLDGKSIVAETQRRVLGDSGNVRHDSFPAAAKKAKCAKPRTSDSHAHLPSHLLKARKATPGGPSAVKRRSRKTSKQRDVQIPAPNRVLRDVEPMLGGDMGHAIHSMLTRLPMGVVDIDAGIVDPFLCPEYAQDILDYAQHIEQGWVLPLDFLENNTEITPQMRGILMDWLIQVQDHLDLQQETLHLCVGLIDRYLHLYNVLLSKMQLLGVTCLFIASKFFERFSPEINTLIHLTDNTYTYEEVIMNERKVLIELKFDMSMPSAIFFLDRLFQVESHNGEIKNTCKYLLDLTLTSMSLVQFPPSLRAAAALFLSRIIWGVQEEGWTQALSYYSKYSERDLFAAVDLMAKTLVKATRSKFQGAKTKYGSVSRFNGISTNSKLLSNVFLAHMVSMEKKSIR